MLKRLLNQPFTNTTLALQLFQIGRYATLFSCGVILVKSGWGIQNVSLYETMLFAASIGSYFWINGILTTVLAHYHEQKFNKNYLFNVFILLLLLSTLLFSVSFLNRHFFIQYLKIPDDRLFLLFLFYLLLNTPSYLTENIYVVVGKPKELCVYGLIVFTMQFGVVLAVAFAKTDLYQLCIAFIALAIFKLLWLFLLVKQNSTILFSSALIRNLLIASFPLILATLLSGSGDYIDKMLVTTLFNKESFAVFQYGARELPLSLLLSTAMASALIPVISTKPVIQACIELKAKSLKLMHLLFPISIVFMFSSNWLYIHFYSQQFAQSATILNIYLLLVLSRVAFPQTLLIAYNFSKVIYKVALWEIMINVSSSYILAGYFGLKGIAYGTLIAFFFEKLVYLWLVKKNLGVTPKQYIALGWWAFYSIMICSSYVFCSLL